MLRLRIHRSVVSATPGAALLIFARGEPSGFPFFFQGSLQFVPECTILPSTGDWDPTQMLLALCKVRFFLSDNGW